MGATDRNTPRARTLPWGPMLGTGALGYFSEKKKPPQPVSHEGEGMQVHLRCLGVGGGEGGWEKNQHPKRGSPGGWGGGLGVFSFMEPLTRVESVIVLGV